MAEHYKGMTSQNEDFEFDVASDSMSLSNIVTGQVNESCNPDTLGLYGGNLPGGGALIDSSGNFKIDVTFNGTLTIDQNTDPTTDHVTITGHFSGSSASGTFLEVTQFTDSSTGTAYTCSSNPQTWTATLTG
jgi:hypothetical protein